MCNAQDTTAAWDVHFAIFEILVASFPSRNLGSDFMHSATVESYLLICSAIEQEKVSTRKFDTCQTKWCCGRVRVFRKKRSEQGLTEALLSVRCPNLKGESGMGCLSTT
jgi:hypothetical protein